MRGVEPVVGYTVPARTGQIVALTAFAAMMIATNIFNNALEVELDEYLFAYRKKSERTS